MRRLQKLMNKKLLSLPYLFWCVAFILIPLCMVFYYGFTDKTGAFTMENILAIATPEHFKALRISILLSLISTLICLLLAYPLAMILSHMNVNQNSFIVLIFILPMWINMLIRTLATVALFDFLRLPLGEGALIFGMVYNFLPFMIYPIYNTLEKMDKSYIEAAQDLGASPAKVFTKVTVPLSIHGVLSGILMVFMPTISTFAISELLTLNKVKLLGTTIQENINNGMWNYGSTIALIMLLIIGVTTLFSDSEDKRDNESGGLI